LSLPVMILSPPLRGRTVPSLFDLLQAIAKPPIRD
jgi:hypothetical protein